MAHNPQLVAPRAKPEDSSGPRSLVESLATGVNVLSLVTLALVGISCRQLPETTAEEYLSNAQKYAGQQVKLNGYAFLKETNTNQVRNDPAALNPATNIKRDLMPYSPSDSIWGFHTTKTYTYSLHVEPSPTSAVVCTFDLGTALTNGQSVKVFYSENSESGIFLK